VSDAMGGLIEESVPAAFDGDRIDRVVAAMTGLSRAAVGRLVGSRDVQINAKPVKAGSTRVREGDMIRVVVPEPTDPRPEPDPNVDFEVVYEDEHLLVVDKPAGLVVHPGAGHAASTLVHGLVARFPELSDVGEAHRPGIVHRLDLGTSGLLVVAKTASVYEALVAQMANHEPERIYQALAWGHPDRDAGAIDAPIGRSTRHPTRMTVTQQGRRAVTHYEVDQRFEQPVECALMTCRLETGRTHQIRVHLRAIGHPVVGDREYDGGRPGLDPGRPFLHAGELRFIHPVSTEQIAVTAPLPEPLVSVLARCS